MAGLEAVYTLPVVDERAFGAMILGLGLPGSGIDNYQVGLGILAEHNPIILPTIIKLAEGIGYRTKQDAARAGMGAVAAHELLRIQASVERGIDPKDTTQYHLPRAGAAVLLALAADQAEGVVSGATLMAELQSNNANLEDFAGFMYRHIGGGMVTDLPESARVGILTVHSLLSRQGIADAANAHLGVSPQLDTWQTMNLRRRPEQT